jgi:hypothetical protein
MLLRLMMEAVLGATLTVIKPDKAEAAEEELAGGRALFVRAMMARQMVFAYMHRKIKEHKQARS